MEFILGDCSFCRVHLHHQQYYLRLQALYRILTDKLKHFLAEQKVF